MALFRHVAAGTFPGEQWSWTLHTTGTGSLASAQTAWVAALSALWSGGLGALVADDVALTEASTASLNESSLAQISRLSDGVTHPGTSTAESLPAQCATAVSLRSATATRSGRGRFYLPPLAVSVMNGGKLSTTSQNAILASVGDMMSSLNGNGLVPVLVNRTTHAQTTITAYDVGDVIDTQRRRRNKLIEERVSADMP